MSTLYVRTELRGGVTVIADCQYTAPLKVAKPFIRGGITEMMIMSASPGLLDGDEVHLRFDIGADCRVRITTQSYGKIFNCDGGAGVFQRAELNVDSGAELEWLPKPVIPFAGARARFETFVNASENCKLLLLDVLTCGRAAMGERFAFDLYRSRTDVTIGKKLAFVDNCRLVPSETDLEGLGFFEGYDCQGLAYAYGFEPHLPEHSGISAGVSKAAEGYSARFLSNSADTIMRLSAELNFSG